MATAIGATRQANVSSQHTPRILVNAACRIVEKLANSSHDDMRAAAIVAAGDLRAALAEGLANVDAMIALLDAPDDSERM